MAQRTYPFTLGAVQIEVDVTKIPVWVDKELKTQLSNVGGEFGRNRLYSDRNQGYVENLILAHALKGLRVKGPGDPKFVSLDLPFNNPLENLPEIEDEEYEDGIDDEIMKRVIEHNGRLHRNPRFREAFGQYAPEKKRGEANPTNSPATEKESGEGSPTHGSSSSSETDAPESPVSTLPQRATGTGS